MIEKLSEQVHDMKTSMDLLADNQNSLMEKVKYDFY